MNPKTRADQMQPMGKMAKLRVLLRISRSCFVTTACTEPSECAHRKLSGNALVGTLPSRWGTHTGLKTIDLADNQLSGPLPRQWSSLLSLHSL